MIFPFNFCGKLSYDTINNYTLNVLKSFLTLMGEIVKSLLCLLMYLSIQDLDQDVIKYARRSDAYSLGVKMKLSRITKMFGLSPEQFGENLQENYAKHEIPEETQVWN